MRRKLSLILMCAVMVAAAVRPAEAQPAGGPIGVLLAPGWNNIGYVGPTRFAGEALAQIAGRYESIWTWEPQSQRWLGMNPLAPQAGDFAEVRQNQAYWIKMHMAGELTMVIPPAQPGVVLTPGWNNFVYPGAEQPVTSALAPALGRFEAVWRWDASRQAWHGFTPASPAASDFTTMAAKRSYFVWLQPGPQIQVASPSAPPTATPSFPTPPQPGTPLPGATAAVPFPSGSPTQFPAGTPAPTTAAGTVANATPSPTPGPRTPGGCYAFQSYQPQTAEVARAQNRAGHGALTTDPDFKLAPLETRTDGSGLPTSAYVPPTLLKAIGWVESGWRQASFNTSRGASGQTIVSTSCAYGLMQILTDMDIENAPNPKQRKVGSDYLSNIAAAAQLLIVKWNFAPEYIPIVQPRNPRSIENWYYAVWAYHCFGEVCDALGIHNNPDDPALKWPRPAYNSPDQLASDGQFTATEYPYQELVYGVIANPPSVNGQRLWQPLPVKLPARGAIGFPEARTYLAPTSTLDPTLPDSP
jgi:hypothetical protein